MVKGGADIQPDKKWTKVHNSILELLASTNFTARELRCLLFLLRMTYGYGCKEHAISLTEWEQGTNMRRGHISQTLQALTERKIILKTETGPRSKPVWTFNKYFEQWQPSTPLGTSFNGIPVGTSNGTDVGTSASTPKGALGSTPVQSTSTPIKEKKDINPIGDAGASVEVPLVEKFESALKAMNATKNKVPHLIGIYRLCFGRENEPTGGELAGAAKAVGSASLLAKYLFDLVSRPPVGPVLPYIIATENARKKRAATMGGNREISEIQFATNGGDIYG